ncbi:MAG: DUF1080 domain-containing protein [Candidatus Aminicenantes bacterium]|nr:DUF1080 domain-containing protein [Candidatus Aminicenantes bacterium]
MSAKIQKHLEIFGHSPGILTFLIFSLLLLSNIGFQACHPPSPTTHLKPEAPPASRESIRRLVDSWLRLLPAQNQAEEEKIFSEMLKTGTPAVEDLGRRLAAPGQADDSLVRYAMDGLVRLAGKPGYEAVRGKLADDLLRLAISSPEPEISKFLLEEAQYVVGQKHLRPLALLLNKKDLVDPTIKAMLRVKSPEVEDILIKQLRQSEQDSINLVSIIQALGRLRSQKAIPHLRRLATSSDPEIRYQALAAIVEAADLSVEPLLRAIPTLTNLEERRQTIGLYLRFARRLAEQGKKEKALEIAEKSLEILTAPDESALRSEALDILTEIAGQKAIPEFLKAIYSQDAAFQHKALNLLRKYRWPELIKMLVENLNSLPPLNRAAVIEFLGNPEIFNRPEAIEPFLEDHELPVRLAAIRTIFNLKKEKSVPDLLQSLPKSLSECQLCLDLLKTLPPESYINFLMEIYPGTNDEVKITILQGIKDFIVPKWKRTVLSALESENPELRKAGADNLFQVMGPEDALWLAESYASLTEPSLFASFQKAFAAVINLIRDAQFKQNLLLNLIGRKSGKERARLIELLPLVGGQEGLNKAVEFLKNPDSEINRAALVSLCSWPDFEASPHLINLIRQSTNRSHRYLAFQALARLLKEPGVDRERKLLVLQELKPLAIYPDEKTLLLNSWGNVRDVRALKELAAFFSDEERRDRAALLACRLARPSAGAEGLSGFETIMIMKKALAYVKDDLEIEETEIYLDKLLRLEGFEPLFNGKDLFGWKGLVQDPVKRARMSPEELAAEQNRADEDMRLHWKVVDGVLVFDGKGHSLCTAKDYCDFELFVDWKIEPGGDSGIYLRGSPQVQIWDPAQWPEGSGGLYNNQKNPNKPLKRADNPVGTWNSFYIKMVGERVTVYLNGELVVDNVVMENYWERDKPIYRCGQIELQAHNTPLYFKNIYVREIK